MDKICRLCLCKGGCISIFSNMDCLPVKIMSCASVQVNPHDELPSTICNKCLEKLNISYEFRKQCQDSDFQLRQITKQNDKETKEDNSDSTPFTNSCKNTICLENNEITGHSEVKLSKAIDEDIYKSSDNKTSVGYLSENAGSDTQNDNTYPLNSSKGDGSKRRREQCSTCGRVMSTRFRLRMHMRTHTGERPHSCTICSRSFTLAQSLKIHIRTHSGEKPLMCAVCGRSFAQYSGLAAHSRLHTGDLPYHCHICGQSFRTTGHLQYHLRKHTGEKKFVCDYCERSFIMRADLTQHIKTHTGEKQHQCALCGVKMTRKSHLTRHMLKHTKRETHTTTACRDTWDLSRRDKKEPTPGSANDAKIVKQPRK